MSFLITELIQNSISHNETGQTVPAGQAPRGVYFETEHFDDVCWYIKNHYDDPNLIQGRATIFATDKFGEFLSKKTLDQLVFRIKRSSISKKFIALSFNLILHTYFSDIIGDTSENATTGYQVQYNSAISDISKNIPTRYQVQCIDLSNNGEFVFYSNWNSLIRLDHNLKHLENWNIPDKFDRQNKGISAEIQQATSILGLQKNPSIDDIKSAFRKNLLQVHPDVNRDDPYASDKTRAVVEAYEILTRGMQNQENLKSDKEFIQIQLPFQGDSITATQMEVGTDNLYVGCYSGKLYLLMRNGKSRLIYDSHAPIRKIRGFGKYLYVVSNQFWDILLDEILVNRIEGNFGFERIIFEKECNAVMVNHKYIRLYSPGGIVFAEITIKENISDVFMSNQKLLVITGKKSYIFSVKPPTDYRGLTSNNLYLPSYM